MPVYACNTYTDTDTLTNTLSRTLTHSLTSMRIYYTYLTPTGQGVGGRTGVVALRPGPGA